MPEARYHEAMIAARLRAVFFLAVLLVLILMPLWADAQLSGKIVTCEGTNCTICHLADTAQNVLNAGIYLAVFLSAVLFAFAGWKYMTAGGDPGKISSAKSIFSNVLIGILIAVASWLAVDTIMKTFVKDDGGFGPWNSVCGLQSDPRTGRVLGPV